MELTIDYMGETAFKAKVRSHEVICDQPAANGGRDQGITPPEFLLASLGTCAGFYAAGYLKARNLPADGLTVKVSAEKSTDRPARIASFKIEVAVPGLDDDRHRAGVLRAVNACLIHNTLLHPPKVEIAVESLVAAVS